MKHYEIRVETREFEHFLNSTCDKCGVQIYPKSYDAYEEDWFQVKEGNIYPEGGHYIEQKMDLCKSCSYKLIELLIQQGYKIRTEEQGY
jgi:hypothetical protein